jgi:protein transport protein SEC24
MRLDHLQRPELNKGTVDFAVSEEYWAPHPPPRISPLYQPVVSFTETGKREPQPINSVFVLEMTADAIRSGFAKRSCDSLLRTLYGGVDEDGVTAEPCIPAESRICIITFDRTLQFYDFTVSNT